MRFTGATPLYKESEPPERECYLSVKLPLSLYNGLVALAASHERSISGETRWLIRQAAEEAGFWEEP